jgi:hypothetical protein
MKSPGHARIARINFVVSSEAYLSGLQWVVAGAHPAGRRQQGYGVWSLAPEGTARERRYPMPRVPLSFSDQQLAAAIDGMEVAVGESTVALKVRS